MPGMKWGNLVSIILVNFSGINRVVLIHCGGNDIGDVPNGALLYHMKFTVAIVVP